jgi:hypothetical protein
MATYGVFTGKIEAINQMLSTIGASRISALASAGEANDAQKILEEVDKAVQTEGWHFNKFYNVELAKGSESMGVSSGYSTTITTSSAHGLLKGDTITMDQDYAISSVPAVNQFVLPSQPTGISFSYTNRVGTPTTALNVDFSIYAVQGDPVVKGRFIYDKYTNSYDWTDAPKATIVYQIPFEQDTLGGESLPEYARRFITMRAARIFAQRHVGDPQLVQYTAKEEQDAYAQFLHAESDNADDNVYQSPLANYIVNRNTSSNLAPIGSLYKV